MDVGRPIAAPLQRCAELLGIDLATVCELAAKVEPYLRADGIRIWSLTQLERQLRPEVYGRRLGHPKPAWSTWPFLHSGVGHCGSWRCGSAW